MTARHWAAALMVCALGLAALIFVKLLASNTAESTPTPPLPAVARDVVDGKNEQPEAPARSVSKQPAPEPGDDSQPAGAGSTGRPVHPITRQIHEQLNKETVYDSLANLLAGREFQSPAGMAWGGGSFDLSIPWRPGGSAENFDWVSVLSNRRVVKLLQELPELPRERAGQLLSEQMMRNLKVYGQLLAERDAGRRAPRTEPDLLSTRLSVTASVFIAGALGLTSASDAVREVTRLALEQRDYCYSLRDESGAEQPFALAGMSLDGFYNPSVLATGIVGTGMIDQATFDEIASPNFYWTEEDLTDWRSPESTYDARRDHFEPDFSLGRVTVGHAINISDEQFDRICEAAGILE